MNGGGLDFKDRVVWITGASAGIGRALARALAGQGAILVLSARNRDRLDQVRRETGLDSERCLVLPLDLANHDTMVVKADTVIAHFGRVDVLVNNGGISQRSLVKDTDIEVDRRIMDVDYFGQVALTKAVLPHMVSRKSGHIVVVSSVTGLVATPLRSAYCAAKHALHGFFECLRAEEYANGIRVVIACPASIKTDISLQALTGDGGRYGQMDDQQAKGLSVEVCARQIIRAVEKEKNQVLIGPPVKYIALVRRFFPKFYSWVIRRVKVT
jgi:dehydrogenase/reductase SDR family protein 7B